MSVTRTRLDPEQRREQLLDLGVRLLETRRLEDLSIDLLAEEAGISRGLLYHYFASKRAFHLAVLRRMADQVIAMTAPSGEGSPAEQLTASLAAFVDFVAANREAYTAFVSAAQAGDEDYQRLYDEARDALIGRIFDSSGGQALEQLGISDTPAVRLLARGWGALVEEVVLGWLEDPHGTDRARLLELLGNALVGVTAGATDGATDGGSRPH